MNAPFVTGDHDTAPTKAAAKAWNHYSCVLVCEECNGTGTVRSTRHASVDDPYPEEPCDHCEGEHEPECPVCGYNRIIPGFVCLACDLALEMPVDAITKRDAGSLVKAILNALEARREVEIARKHRAEMDPAYRATLDAEYGA